MKYQDEVRELALCRVSRMTAKRRRIYNLIWRLIV